MWRIGEGKELIRLMSMSLQACASSICSFSPSVGFSFVNLPVLSLGSVKNTYCLLLFCLAVAGPVRVGGDHTYADVCCSEKMRDSPRPLITTMETPVVSDMTIDEIQLRSALAVVAG